MKYILSLLLIILFTAVAPAQVVPGYRGKRVFTELTSNLGLAVDHPNLRGRVLRLTNRSQASFGYVLTRRFTLVASVAGFKIGREDFTNNSGLRVINRIQGRSAGIGINFMRKPADIAPIGSSWGLFYQYGRATDTAHGEFKPTTQEFTKYENVSTEGLSVPFHTIGFQYQLRKFLADKLFYQFGANIAYSFGKSEEDFSTTDDIYQRINGMNTFAVQIGMGYFLF